MFTHYVRQVASYFNPHRKKGLGSCYLSLLLRCVYLKTFKKPNKSSNLDQSVRSTVRGQIPASLHHIIVASPTTLIASLAGYPLRGTEYIHIRATKKPPGTISSHCTPVSGYLHRRKASQILTGEYLDPRHVAATIQFTNITEQGKCAYLFDKYECW